MASLSSLPAFSDSGPVTGKDSDTALSSVPVKRKRPRGLHTERTAHNSTSSTMSKRSRCVEAASKPGQSSLRAPSQRRKREVKGWSPTYFKTDLPTDDGPSKGSQKAPVQHESEFPTGDSCTQSICTEYELHLAQDALLRAEAKISMLQNEVRLAGESVLKMKQDVLLDYIMKTRSSENHLRQLRKEKHNVQLRVDEQKKANEELQTKLDVVTDKWKKACIQNTMHQDDHEHFTTYIKVLQSDLDDLTQLESEEAQRRRKSKEGLPPAYSERLRRDKRAPYDQHKDAGEFDEETLSMTIEEDFEEALRKAHKYRIKCRESTNESSRTKGDAVIFTSVANALAVTALKLKPVLRSTDDMGDWIAEFVLELSWKAVAACEVRPAAIYLTTKEKSRTSICWREADECLLEAFKKSLDERLDKKSVLLVYDLQDYLTRTMALQRSCLQLHTHISYEYFEKSVRWLTEQVESERFRQANGSVIDGSSSGDSVTSSEGEGAGEGESEREGDE